MAKFCRGCGRELTDQQLFCPACGTKAEEVQAPQYTQAPEYTAQAQETTPAYEQYAVPEYQQDGVGVQVAKPPMDNKKLMVIGGALAAVAVVVILLVVLLGKGGSVSASTAEEAGELMAKARFTDDYKTESDLLFYDLVEEDEFYKRKEYEQYASMLSSMYDVDSYGEYIEYGAKMNGYEGANSVEDMMQMDEEKRLEEIAFEYGEDYKITTIATQTPCDAEDLMEIKSEISEDKMKAENDPTKFNYYEGVDIEKIEGAAEVKVIMTISGSLKTETKERSYTAINYGGTWKIYD